MNNVVTLDTNNIENIENDKAPSKHMWDISEADYRNGPLDTDRSLQSYDDGSGLLDLETISYDRKGRKRDKDIISNEPLFNDEKTLEKRRARAKRFDIPGGEDEIIAEKRKELLETMSISVETCSFEGFRYNCLHMVGLDHMSEDDIFEYLNGHEPMKIEWIDDSSCNLLYNTVGMACQALSEISVPIEQPPLAKDDPTPAPTTAETENDSKSETNNDPEMKEGSKEEHAEKNEEIKKKHVDNHLSFDADGDVEMDFNESNETAEQQNWRSKVNKDTAEDGEEHQREEEDEQADDGKEDGEITDTDEEEEFARKWKGYRKSIHNGSRDLPDNIFFRFAKHTDRKIRRANEKSEYYVIHGNPNYRGMKGYLTKGLKKRMREGLDDDMDAPYERKPKALTTLITGFENEILSEDESNSEISENEDGSQPSLAVKIMKLRSKKMDRNISASHKFKCHLKRTQRNIESKKWQKISDIPDLNLNQLFGDDDLRSRISTRRARPLSISDNSCSDYNYYDTTTATATSGPTTGFGGYSSAGPARQGRDTHRRRRNSYSSDEDNVGGAGGGGYRPGVYFGGYSGGTRMDPSDQRYQKHSDGDSRGGDSSSNNNSSRKQACRGGKATKRLRSAYSSTSTRTNDRYPRYVIDDAGKRVLLSAEEDSDSYTDRSGVDDSDGKGDQRRSNNNRTRTSIPLKRIKVEKQDSDFEIDNVSKRVQITRKNQASSSIADTPASPSPPRGSPMPTDGTSSRPTSPTPPTGNERRTNDRRSVKVTRRRGQIKQEPRSPSPPRPRGNEDLPNTPPKRVLTVRRIDTSERDKPASSRSQLAVDANGGANTTTTTTSTTVAPAPTREQASSRTVRLSKPSTADTTAPIAGGGGDRHQVTPPPPNNYRRSRSPLKQRNRSNRSPQQLPVKKPRDTRPLSPVSKSAARNSPKLSYLRSGGSSRRSGSRSPPPPPPPPQSTQRNEDTVSQHHRGEKGSLVVVKQPVEKQDARDHIRMIRHRNNQLKSTVSMVQRTSPERNTSSSSRRRRRRRSRGGERRSDNSQRRHRDTTQKSRRRRHSPADSSSSSSDSSSSASTSSTSSSSDSYSSSSDSENSSYTSSSSSDRASTFSL